MTAAIYVRKSTDQSSVTDEQRSVARQIEHARAYASKKGWTVADEHVYADDGISGAEFANRPGFLRLMNALKPRAPFQILVMSEESRLGREAIETAYALKQLVQAGVRIFFYLEDRERTLDSPTDKIMMSLTAFADELEREKARQRTYDAMVRKAKAGHVTGGRVFGYDNVEILGPDGQRSHVERRINEAEAAVVRRIFDLSAGGAGLTRITKELNADGVAAPRPQQGRPSAWVASSVREVLLRPLYRGEIVWNQSRKRDKWGQQHQQPRSEAEWMRIPAPGLAIVPETLWHQANAQFAERRRTYLAGNRSHRESPYLLSGFARCAICGGGFASHTRSHGKQRAMFYGCTSHWKRGPRVCSNGLVGRMESIDDEVIATLRDDILRPAVVERAIELALEELQPQTRDRRRDGLEKQLHRVDEQCERLTDALADGVHVQAVVKRLRSLQERRDAIDAELAAIPSSVAPALADGLEQRARAQFDDWRGMLTRDVEGAREVLRILLAEPIRFTPVEEDTRIGFYFASTIALDRAIGGLIIVKNTDWSGVPDGIRTRVSALKGPRPGPLDDGDTCCGPGEEPQPISLPCAGGRPARTTCRDRRRLAVSYFATRVAARFQCPPSGPGVSDPRDHFTLTCHRIGANCGIRDGVSAIVGRIFPVFFRLKSSVAFARRLSVWSTESYSVFDARMVTAPAATLLSV